MSRSSPGVTRNRAPSSPAARAQSTVRRCSSSLTHCLGRSAYCKNIALLKSRAARWPSTSSGISKKMPLPTAAHVVCSPSPLSARSTRPTSSNASKCPAISFGREPSSAARSSTVAEPARRSASCNSRRDASARARIPRGSVRTTSPAAFSSGMTSSYPSHHERKPLDGLDPDSLAGVSALVAAGPPQLALHPDLAERTARGDDLCFLADHGLCSRPRPPAPRQAQSPGELADLDPEPTEDREQVPRPRQEDEREHDRDGQRHARSISPDGRRRLPRARLHGEPSDFSGELFAVKTDSPGSSEAAVRFIPRPPQADDPGLDPVALPLPVETTIAAQANSPSTTQPTSVGSTSGQCCAPLLAA